MALSRKSMVDSVYTIWNTCPSSEHSSSAATCGGQSGTSLSSFQRPGPQASAPRFPAGQHAPAALPPAQLAPHPSQPGVGLGGSTPDTRLHPPAAEAGPGLGVPRGASMRPPGRGL